MTVEELQTLTEQISQFKEYVLTKPKPSKTKCKNLFGNVLNKSKTLFDLIYDKYDTQPQEISARIELFIKLLTDISSDRISQYDASVKVGKHLADKYIFCYDSIKH